MLRTHVIEPLRNLYEVFVLPQLTKATWLSEEHDEDADPGIAPVVDAAVSWLCRAQDCSASLDGGVARHYSLTRGWAASYPETTGYIIPTLLDVAADRHDTALRERVRRMLDWLVSIQLPNGGFQGGVVGQAPVVPVTFNTGQILIGLARGVTEFGERYLPTMHAAANWLVTTQDDDGAWRRHGSPFAAAGEKVYDTHVAFGLLEAARVDPASPYADAALKNVRWALTHQQHNGWFANCALADHRRPLTHTIGYALRGVLEAYRFTGEREFLDAAMRTAHGVLRATRGDGFLPGRLDAHWHGTVDWVCLTGSVQIAYCWFVLFLVTGDARLRDAALAVNRYVRTTVRINGSPEICGGVAGSFPIFGAYGRLEYLNWANKFFIDANRLELTIQNAATRRTAKAPRAVPSVDGVGPYTACDFSDDTMESFVPRP